MRKLLGTILLAVSPFMAQADAATPALQSPGQIQTLIDDGKCNEAISLLGQVRKATDDRKRSDLFDVLMIDAAMCANQILPGSSAAKYAYETLTFIEKSDPFLWGMDVHKFNQLKADVKALMPKSAPAPKQAVEDWSWGVILFTGSLIVVTFVFVSRLAAESSSASSRSKTRNESGVISGLSESNKNILKGLVEKAQKSILKLDEEIQRRQIKQENTATLSMYMDSIQKMKLEIEEALDSGTATEDAIERYNGRLNRVITLAKVT